MILISYVKSPFGKFKTTAFVIYVIDKCHLRLVMKDINKITPVMVLLLALQKNILILKHLLFIFNNCSTTFLCILPLEDRQLINLDGHVQK